MTCACFNTTQCGFYIHVPGIYINMYIKSMVFILPIVMHGGEKVLYTCDRVLTHRGAGVVHTGHGDTCTYIATSKYEAWTQSKIKKHR